MLDPQNFSVKAGNDTDVFIDIDPDDGITLSSADITWRAYPQSMGLPIDGEAAVIEKTNSDGGTIVVVDPETQKLKVPLTSADTEDLLRNYYHVCTVDDAELGVITVAEGIMTVTNVDAVTNNIPTASSIKLRFPEFVDVPDATIEFIIEEMQLVVGVNFTIKRNLAMLYYTAHHVSLSISAADSAGMGSDSSGIAAENIGRLSISYARSGAAKDTSISSLKSTSYGKRYLEIVRGNFGGPIIA